VNILMLTNTYLPHVGGVARSVASFAAEYRRRGHRVLIVAPQFEGQPAEETDVVRIPALQNFNGSDFSVRLPVPGFLTQPLDEFRPDVVHSHHPFLLGDTAVRIAAARQLPLVFTNHTMYEQYTHYVPVESPVFGQFVIDLVVGYTDLCDAVIAPSESVREVLKKRGVVTPMEVIPTGVDAALHAEGDGARVRCELGLPSDAFVVGHVGRLAQEKNLPFLSQALARFLRQHRRAHGLIVGSGPAEETMRQIFRSAGVERRVHWSGARQGQALVDAYHAMNVFAFASRSETQGMVVTEAMAAGVPVVAIDAPGVREVVVDGTNGRLLPSADVRSFAKALGWLAQRPAAEREKLNREALRTGRSFAMPHMADRALALYSSLVGKTVRKKESEDSTWEAAVRLMRSEWDLWANIAQAATAALQSPQASQVPVIGPAVRGWRAVRRWFNRSGWEARLLGLPPSTSRVEQGLILVQIDGLSRSRLEQAIAKRRLPFLRRLLGRESYQLHTHYSGVPAATAAVQGELFYGVKTAVPAHGFADRTAGQIREMLESQLASEVQQRLARGRLALLAGGSAYCNIYTGGAAEPHFCASSTGWGEFMRYLNPIKFLTFCLLHIPGVLRTLWAMFVELVMVFIDCVRGLIGRGDVYRELKFIPARVGVCAVMPELMTIGAGIDIVRGMPIIHLNYLGYDEQAHHRGPDSIRAYRSLKAIDRAIGRLWWAARQSHRREYSIWIYSDHGQERVTPYTSHTGRPVQEAIQAVLDRIGLSQSVALRDGWHKPKRAGLLGGRGAQRLAPPSDAQASDVLVAGVGPLGHIYLSEDALQEDIGGICRELVSAARIPLVLTARGGPPVRAWTAEGEFQLPRDAESIFGADHPFREEVARDLAELCHHAWAGDIVIGGWSRVQQPPLSFATEWGAHGGPGPQETAGFAILPNDAAQMQGARPYYRPLDLRQMALEHLRGRETPRRRRRAVKTGELRIVTYNVHSCIGLDGRLSVARIGRILDQCDADVVAVQELDVARTRTGLADQARQLAEYLGMEHYSFHPTFAVGTERFGNAVFSRYPLRFVHAANLPTQSAARKLEPRSALWVAVVMPGGELQLINTHLGLLMEERVKQVEALLGSEWLGHPACRDPVVLCGDFNAWPGSRPYRRIRSRLRDAQQSLSGHRPRSTWMSPFPFRRIDHVFISASLEVASIQVPVTHLARLASDHLPLAIDLHVKWTDQAPTPTELVSNWPTQVTVSQ